MDDVSKMGREIRPIDSYDSPIGENEYRIALRTTTNDTANPDYHFMVQHSDGSWSHKPGFLPARKLEGNNPTDAKWPGYGVQCVVVYGKIYLQEYITEPNRYSSETRYFAVTRKETP